MASAHFCAQAKFDAKRNRVAKAAGNVIRVTVGMVVVTPFFDSPKDGLGTSWKAPEEAQGLYFLKPNRSRQQETRRPAGRAVRSFTAEFCVKDSDFSGRKQRQSR
jgi:hypothetical protein